MKRVLDLPAWVIVGDSNGFKYWIQLAPSKREYAPDFQWNGLINNATVFYDYQVAKNVLRDLNPFVKINCAIVTFK